MHLSHANIDFFFQNFEKKKQKKKTRKKYLQPFNEVKIFLLINTKFKCESSKSLLLCTSLSPFTVLQFNYSWRFFCFCFSCFSILLLLLLLLFHFSASAACLHYLPSQVRSERFMKRKNRQNVKITRFQITV